MITDYFMITEKSNRLQVIMITDYDYPISGIHILQTHPQRRFYIYIHGFRLFSRLVGRSEP